MLCRGGCGKDALYGAWCSERYYDCTGYKKNYQKRRRSEEIMEPGVY